jgi:hypothetical protein
MKGQQMVMIIFQIYCKMIIVARWYLQHDDRQIKRSPCLVVFSFLFFFYPIAL